MELVWSDALAAVGCNGQGISLSIYAKKFQVEEAVSKPTLSGATKLTVVVREGRTVQSYSKIKKIYLQLAKWLCCVVLTTFPKRSGPVLLRQ